MKLKLTLICAVVAMLVFLFACAPAPKQASVEVSCDDFYKQNAISKEVKVPADSSLTVTLCSNPTTGFQWSESAQISAPAVLQQTEHQFVGPESEPPPPPGTPSQEIWTFKALNKGTSTISLEYSRPWEGGEKGTWTFVLIVVIEKTTTETIEQE